MNIKHLIGRLSSPCLLIGHGNLLMTRVDDVLSLECERCHHIQPILASEVITTPLPQVIAGAVTTKARSVSPKRSIVMQMRSR